MWMTSYINSVKRGFRDIYNFIPSGGTESEPLFKDIPDGIYPMKIKMDMDIDYVSVKDGHINCCNYTAPTDMSLIKQPLTKLVIESDKFEFKG